MLKRILYLVLGLLLNGLGIALVIKSGTSFPITAFNLGVSNTLNISYGFASMLVEVITIFVNYLFKEKIGITTLMSAIFSGYLVDLCLKLIPTTTYSIIYLPLGSLIMCFGFYFMSICGLGLNSSNGLMNALQKLTKKSTGTIRTIEEISFMLFGFLLGGTVNIGTILLSCCFGYLLGFVYKSLKYKSEEQEHRYLFD